MNTLRGWLRVALIDLRGGLRRFAILLACLGLGVGTIAVVGSIGAALQSALLRDARTALGGDIEAQLSYRLANAEELALFHRLGRVAEVVEVLGRASTDQENAFVAIRAVDANYPLIGRLELRQPPGNATPLPDLLAPEDGAYGLIADSLLLDRLGLALGDRLQIGAAQFILRGVIGRMPDQITQGVQFGIQVLMSVEALQQADILAPGVLARHRYKIELAGTDFDTASAEIKTAFPSANWLVSSPKDATSDIARFFDMFARFLTIVGLSSLLVGGVGVSSAIAAYVTERQRSIATMRALGATAARIQGHFLIQVVLLTLLGVVIGLLLGIALTYIALPIIGDLLSIDLPAVLDPVALGTAAGFGLLIGFAFAYLPLRRALSLRPALLFRSAGSAAEGGLGWRDLLRPGLWLPLLLAFAGIFALATLTTGRPSVVTWYAIGAVGAFLLLRLAAFGLQALLRLIPPLPNANLRNALKSIHRPGAPAPVVIMSLGLGLALLLMIALIDSNLRNQLSAEAIPDAPDFVFMDLFEDEVAELKDFAAAEPQVASFEATSLVRGRFVSVNDVPVADLGKPPSEFRFLVDDEIPLTTAGPLPERSTVVEGKWWPDDWDGEPQVSVYERLKDPLGLKLGDIMTFSIYGQEVRARLTSFRDFAWRSGGINFAFALSPNALAGTDISYLGMMKAAPDAAPTLQKTLVADFPGLIFLPVGDALESFATILASVTSAVEVIGGLAVISGLFVLAGAMVAGRQQREADAVVMKVLGATRGDVVRAYLVEYGLLGALAALLAALLGVTGTWIIVEYLMEIHFSFDAMLILWVVLGAVALTILVGVVTTWSALSVRPARFLREE